MRIKAFLVMLTCLSGITFASDGQDWIEHWGVTWKFDKKISTTGTNGTYQYGTFANGDYWIVGPIKIISITPKSETVDYNGPWTKNGSMLNPVCRYDHGFDSRGSGADAKTKYNADLNVAIGVSAENPLEIVNGSTLVSSISQSTPDNWPQLKTAAVLTVLASAPPAGSFRPAICGTDKTIKFNESDLLRGAGGADGYSYLSALAPVANTPSLATVENWFARPWIEIQKGYTAGRMFPSDNMPSYGREISKHTSQAVLALNLDYANGNPKLDNDTLKRKLLISYVQTGIDLYGFLTSNALGRVAWEADGGIHHGRKLPILFAAYALDDNDMKAIFTKTGAYIHSYEDADGYANPYGSCSTGTWLLNPPDHYYFQEDDQVYYVTQFHVDATNNNVAGKIVNGINYKGFPAFSPDSRFPLATPYTKNDIGLPDWSYRPCQRPNTIIAGPHFDYANYREEAGCSHPAIALAVHIMGLKDTWNNPALFDYADRYMRMIENIDKVWGIAEPVNTWENIFIYQEGINGVGSFVRNMWSTYRADYGPSWKPGPEYSDWPNTKTALYSLIVNTTNCSVTRNPNKDNYTSDEEVILTTKPLTGYKFSGWTIKTGESATTFSANPLTITMNGNKTVTAICGPIDPSEGQVSHWLLDNYTDKTTADTNYFLLSSLASDPIWSKGWRINENWLELLQSNQAVIIPTMGMSPQAGTIAVWVEPKDFSGMKFIFGHVLNNTNRLSLYTVAGSLAVGLGSNATLKTNIMTLPLGQPVHLALSWNGTSYTVYVNGTQKDAGTFSGLTTLNSFIDIGNYGDPAYRTLGFVGNIDDIRIYNRALASTEVDALYYTHNVRQGKELRFTVNAVNAQGIPVAYQAASMPEGARFDTATQQVTWTPWYNQSGLYTFRFTATGQPERLVTVEVHNTESIPWYIGVQNILPVKRTEN